MSKESVEIVRRNYEVINSIGRTGREFVDPESGRRLNVQTNAVPAQYGLFS